MLIAAGRKIREIDPALEALRNCTNDADQDESVSPVARQRLRAMLDFTTSVDRWYEQMQAISPTKRDIILKMGAKIASFIPLGRPKKD